LTHTLTQRVYGRTPAHHCDILRHGDMQLARDETPQEHRVHKPTSLLLARNKGAQRKQGNAQPYPSNHRGRARSPQPSQLSWQADFACEKGQGCAAVWTTYLLALQRQRGHGHAMQHAGGGGARNRATLSDPDDKRKVEWACWRVEWAREHALQAGALASLSEMAPLLRHAARRS
jgi:hypothetical protein